MWIGRTEYVSLCERVARLEAAEEARRGGMRCGAPPQQTEATAQGLWNGLSWEKDGTGGTGWASAQSGARPVTADARRLAAQFENLLAYDGTAQTGGEEDAEE